MATLKETLVNVTAFGHIQHGSPSVVFLVAMTEEKFLHGSWNTHCISHCLSPKGGTDTLTITVLLTSEMCARQHRKPNK